MKLNLMLLITGIAVLLIGSNDSLAQKNTSGTDRSQTKFNKMDTDGDGKVSRIEYMKYKEKRAENKFSRKDTDKDGFLTLEETKGAKSDRKKRSKKKSEKEEQQ